MGLGHLHFYNEHLALGVVRTRTGFRLKNGGKLSNFLFSLDQTGIWSLGYTDKWLTPRHCGFFKKTDEWHEWVVHCRCYSD